MNQEGDSTQDRSSGGEEPHEDCEGRQKIQNHIDQANRSISCENVAPSTSSGNGSICEEPRGRGSSGKGLDEDSIEAEDDSGLPPEGDEETKLCPNRGRGVIEPMIEFTGPDFYRSGKKKRGKDSLFASLIYDCLECCF